MYVVCTCISVYVSACLSVPVSVRAQLRLPGVSLLVVDEADVVVGHTFCADLEATLAWLQVRGGKGRVGRGEGRACAESRVRAAAGRAAGAARVRRRDALGRQPALRGRLARAPRARRGARDEPPARAAAGTAGTRTVDMYSRVRKPRTCGVHMPNVRPRPHRRLCWRHRGVRSAASRHRHTHLQTPIVTRARAACGAGVDDMDARIAALEKAVTMASGGVPAGARAGVLVFANAAEVAEVAKLLLRTKSAFVRGPRARARGGARRSHVLFLCARCPLAQCPVW